MTSLLRQSAAHKACTLRLPGCQGSPCVLAHYRVIGVSGMGHKPPDLVAAFACTHCHDLVDRRAGHLSQLEIDAAFARGMARTLAQWLKDGTLALYFGA